MNARLQTVAAYIVARCKEASTWRGLILVVTALTGYSMPPEKAAAITLIGIAAAGLVGMLFGDQKPSATAPTAPLGDQKQTTQDTKGTP